MSGQYPGHMIILDQSEASDWGGNHEIQAAKIGEFLRVFLRGPVLHCIVSITALQHNRVAEEFGISCRLKHSSEGSEVIT